MIESRTCTDSTTVCPSGELDLAAAVQLREVITKISEPGTNVVVDLCNVGFVEAAGLRILAHTANRARAIGGTASMANANPRIQWLLGLTSADRPVPQCEAIPRHGAA
jgi:anti-anti-sigma factor